MARDKGPPKDDEKSRAIKAKAVKLAQKGQHRKAIKEYEKLIEHQPGDIRTLHRLAELWARVGDKKKSVDNFLKVADGYIQDGFTERAAAIFKQALAVDALRIDVNLRLAKSYEDKGLERDAVCHLLKAAAVYEKEERQSAELQMLQRAAEMAPGDVDVRLHLARVYVRMDQPEKAKEEFLDAALQLKKAGRTDEFITMAERVLQIGEADLELYLSLAECYIQREEWLKVPKVLEIPLRSRSDDFRTLELSARAFLGMEQPDRAVAVYKRIVRIAKARGLKEHEDLAREKLHLITGKDEVTGQSRPPPIPEARAKAGEREITQPAKTDRPDQTQPDSVVGLDEEFGEDEKTPVFDVAREVLGYPDEVPDLSRDDDEEEAEENTMAVAIKDLLAEVGGRDLSGVHEVDPGMESGLKEGLEVVDFYMGQGLLDEATTELDKLAREHGAHPAISSRREDIQNLKGISTPENGDTLT